ncbi:MAG: TldD/PmbA family protein [Treponema sp.]
MQVVISKLLSEKKSLLKKLIKELSKEFEYASILATDSKGKTFTVRKKSISVGDSFMCTECGYVVRVYNGIGYSEYSFNVIEDVSSIVSKMKEIAKTDVDFLKNNDVSFVSYPLIKEEETTKTFFAEIGQPLDAMNAKEKIEYMTKIMQKGLAYNSKLIDFVVNYEEVQVSKMFLSTKKDLEQSYVYSIGYLVPYLKEGEVVKYSLRSFSRLAGVELLESMMNEVEKSCDNVVDILNAEPITAGVYDIICAPEVTGLIAHEAFGHGVEMDMFVKNRAKAKDYIGKPVASNVTEMHDGASAASQVSSYLFDDEGTLAQDTCIIKNGVLQTGMCDLLSALNLGIKPTGNGKRESFERKAYARMTNTFFSVGNATLDEMIKSVEKGYLLEGYFSGMEDPKNWGIQCAVEKGREIINGKLTGKIVGPIFLTGYVPTLLSSISMISNSKDFSLCGGGYCGKGYKEFVRVSMGGSYIKAQGRLG